MSARAIFLVIGAGTLVGLAWPGSETAPSATLSNGDDPAAYARATDKALDTVLKRQPNGHFYVDALVNGRVVHFLVDTGASTVALTEEDATRVGFKFSDDEYEVVGRGAAGELLGKQISIRHVAIGQKEAWDMRGVILDNSEVSLLGQNVLGQIGSVQIANDRMILR
ncbi:retropepsin-like aspartic protease family protein [Sphingomonas cavernae]|uniref:retropepsin-like aspartic protease family protein n=1 Tax=Sphingomonas cavernae TaxID=2320861 RepID=UPI0016001EB5|nr:TIGR02281 family clan AA aspartic protease [Sphingomonas cavernae]